VQKNAVLFVRDMRQLGQVDWTVAEGRASILGNSRFLYICNVIQTDSGYNPASCACGYLAEVKRPKLKASQLLSSAVVTQNMCIFTFAFLHALMGHYLVAVLETHGPRTVGTP
jgi:hypothetical protein